MNFKSVTITVVSVHVQCFCLGFRSVQYSMAFGFNTAFEIQIRIQVLKKNIQNEKHLNTA